ncbi:fatty-acyl-CoA synthase [Saccharopolyspora antimicrobica]|uniref:Fatty-acyl-CoA synthase n=1 Tax=Saccharopolyspora antimicrobica TaxID=455193 RepID=A0A1I4TCN7_9PSEU|nr:fatty acyl-CoA synthetase [Saccharopolyspora antimicrobica]RKT85772.1 fatty-acyl-CoA synthase [Saccharopolyspora antimicrobica]SFM74383.1 fatty-acyl-CoA synthase [Saccharopolyspora antimicrobica]
MSDLRASTVADVLRRSAARVPDRVALRFVDGAGREAEWTYAELDDAVSRAAGLLLAAGAGKGDRIAAYGKNSDAYLIGFLACARAGLVHVPINYNLTSGELAYLLAQSESSIALVDPSLAGELDRVRAETPVRQVIPLRGDEDSLLARCVAGPVPELDVEVSDDDLVQLLYTSGTTSLPKGAMMTHRALLHEYLSCLAALDFAEDDQPLHVMPLYHSAQMHVFLLPNLMIGATNRLLEVLEPGEVLRRIEDERIGSFFAAPTVWVALANHADFAERDLKSLRKAYYGASIMPGPVLQRLRERLPELGFYNCFGQSEIAPLATVLRPEEHDERPDSAGRPVLFVEAKVVDEQGAEVAPGESGEIVYRSPQLCTGYWNKPAETAEAFRGGWFHSGDLVRRDEAGYVFVVDRIKDVINTGGVLVASREVEDVLYAHPAVAEVAVVAVPDPKWIERIAAVVVAKAEVTEAELVEHARGRLAGFKVPKEIHFLDDLPRNSSGKLLKRVLRDQLAG